MHTEIEAKLKVDSLQEIEDRLRQLGAAFVAELSQEDVLFDDVCNTLTRADSCLRLRSQAAGGKTKYILGYKGTKEKSSFKKRREIEIEVSSGESAKAIFSALGYEQKIIVEKKRSLYRFGDCEIALDRLKLLGDFVEIEGPDEKAIKNVQKKLNLEHLKHIPKSYASLIADKLKQPNK
jgi:predicted adenylyl cyclase CyaB